MLRQIPVDRTIPILPDSWKTGAKIGYWNAIGLCRIVYVMRCFQKPTDL